MPFPSWDPDYLAQLEIDTDGREHFLCLSSVSFRILSDLFQLAGVDARWTDPTDARRAVWLQTLESELYMGQLDDILADIKAGVEALSLIANSTGPCGCGDGPDDEGVVVGQGTVPQPIIDAGYPDWVDWPDYICAAANVFHDAVEENMEDIKDLLDAGGAVFSAVVAVATVLGPFGWAFAASVATAGAVFEVLTGGLGEVLMQEIIDDWNDNRDDIICAIADATTAQIAYDDWLAIRSQIGGPLKDVMLDLLVTREVFNAIFQGADGNGNPVKLGAYNGEPCSCGQPAAPDVFDWPIDNQGWVSQGMQAPQWQGGIGNPGGALHLTPNTATLARTMEITGDATITTLALPATLGVPLVLSEFRYDVTIAVGTESGWVLQVFLTEAGTANRVAYDTINSNSLTAGVWLTRIVALTPPLSIRTSGVAMEISVNRFGDGGDQGSKAFRVDNFTIFWTQ